MNDQLTLHQELVLLSLNNSKGHFESPLISYGLAGAMLSELMLLKRIISRGEHARRVELVCQESTGDSLMDSLLAEIASAKKPMGLDRWVSSTAKRSDLPHRVAKQLADKGILKRDELKVLWVFSKRVYPEVDGSWEDAICQRMSQAMFDETTLVDERTAVLISFAKCTDLLNSNFSRLKLERNKVRIEAICNGEHLASSATKATIASVKAAQAAAMTAAALLAVNTSIIANQ